MKLDVGDYGVRFHGDHVPPVVFERKSMADLFGTMTKGYPRFRRELLRAQASKVTLILIVEGTLSEVYRGVPRSSWPGERVVQKLFTLQMKYGVQPVFCRDRQEIAAYMLETFSALGRAWISSKKGRRAIP